MPLLELLPSNANTILLDEASAVYICSTLLVQKELQNLKDASDDLMLVDDDVIPYPNSHSGPGLRARGWVVLKRKLGNMPMHAGHSV